MEHIVEFSDSTEQNYSSTLVFNIPASNFDDESRTCRTEPITRTFNRTSANLSQKGFWLCAFTESKKRSSGSINLELLLVWTPRSEQEQHGQSRSSGYQRTTAPTAAAAVGITKSRTADSSESTNQQKKRSVMMQEPVSRIKSFTVRSDATMSVLQVEPLDGRAVLQGCPVQSKVPQLRS